MCCIISMGTCLPANQTTQLRPCQRYQRVCRLLREALIKSLILAGGINDLRSNMVCVNSLKNLLSPVILQLSFFLSSIFAKIEYYTISKSFLSCYSLQDGH